MSLLATSPSLADVPIIDVARGEFLSPLRSPCLETSNSVAFIPTPKSVKRTRHLSDTPKVSTKKKARKCTIPVAAPRPPLSAPTPLIRRGDCSQTNDPSLLLNPHSIESRAMDLFGTSKGVLSRILSCHSLQSTVSHSTFKSRSPLRRSSPRICRLSPREDPVWSFLKALVHLEVISLSSDPPQPEEEPPRKRCCSWSPSVVSPPVDRVDGSADHMNQVLEALISVQDLIHSAWSISDVAALMNTVSFLATMQEDGSTVAAACAKSISDAFSVKRVVQAAGFYHSELSILVHRLEESTTPLQPHTTAHRFLNVEQRLGTWLGQAIRCNLRILLNPAPPRLGPADVDYDVRSQLYSQVADSIELQGGDETSDAVKEVHLSTLVSRALDVVYLYHGDNAQASDLPTVVSKHETWSIDQSPLLQSVLEKPSRDKAQLPKTPELAASIGEVAFDASAFMGCHSAAQFLVDLFQIDFVHSEIQRRGGMEDLETYATMLWKFHLASPGDAHLVLLSNVQSLIDRLSVWTQQTQAQADEGWDTLQALHKKVKKWPKNDRFGLDGELHAHLAFSRLMPSVTMADTDPEAENESDAS